LCPFLRWEWIAAETAARVVAMACTEPPHEATHWTGRAMAKAIGISLGSVQRIRQAHKLQPHRLARFVTATLSSTH
jgi:hypothetical protein